MINIKNKEEFLNFIKPFGTHVEFIIGNYYAIRKINMDHNLYEILKYAENFNEPNTKRLIYGCEPTTKLEVSSEECVKLIIKEQRKRKLEKIEDVCRS